MPQFAIHKNKNPQTKSIFPLLLDIQPNLLEDLPTRAVIPLTQSSSVAQKPFAPLHGTIVEAGHER